MIFRLAAPVLFALVFLLACSGGAPPVPAAPAAPASAAATATTTASQTLTPTATPGIATGPPTHDVQRAMQHLATLANTIGPRVAGSQGEQRAAGYIAGELRSDGYDVELMPFEFTGDRFRPASVTIGTTAVDAVALDGSSGGAVTAESVFVGLADDAGIAGQSLSGKIAVADRGTLTFAEKYDNVTRFGAAALVVLNNQPGQVNGRARQGGTIPVVAVAGEDAPTVRDAARLGARLTVEAQASGKTQATNVIARSKPGANCGLIVGGHYDSVAATGAANDNASGVANMLEVARALAVTSGPPPGLCFAAWSGEESGLFGSAAFVEREQAVNRLPGLYLNLDVTGIGPRVEIIGESDVDQRALDIARAASIPAARIQLPPNTGSDHQSFEKAHVPVVYLSSGDFPTIHSPADVVKDIDPHELDRIGRLTILIVQALLPQVAHGGGHS